MSKVLSAIDLFCGIGGLSYGLQKSGIKVRAGVDLDNSCRYSYEKNTKADFISEDISLVTGDFLKNKYWNREDEIKILVGCAPCQPFSTHSNKNKDKENDSKWNLLYEFKRLILELQPSIVSMENVPNLSNQKVFSDFLDFLESNKYFIDFKNVFCPDYGIPQKRRRLVLLASKFGNIQLIPTTHTIDNYVTVKEVIGGLPKVQSGRIHPEDPLHRTTKLSKINLDRIRSSKPNGTWLDWDEKLRLNCHKKESGKSYQAVYGRMAWNEPSPTITTQFYNFGTGRFGHPSQNRALTIREAALLQTFPIDYAFYQKEEDIKMTKLGTHIGNAVPVKLGEVIGKSIKKHLKIHKVI